MRGQVLAIQGFGHVLVLPTSKRLELTFGRGIGRMQLSTKAKRSRKMECSKRIS